MINKTHRNIILVLSCFVIPGITSCIYDSEITENSIKENQDIRGITLLLDSRATNDENGVIDGDIEESQSHPIIQKVDEVLNDGFKEDFSIFYISQMGRSIGPDFSEENNDNLYYYIYYNNPDAWWGPDNEAGQSIGGYNFTPKGDKALNWNQITELGQNGNGYVFCGLYFPVDNKMRFEIETDQSNLYNHRKSNVLGAKHSTKDTNIRLRFMVYHLMAYLHVSLYVPIFDAEDNSGYLEDALRQGLAMGLHKNFVVQWATETGADQSPNIDYPQDDETTDILMYIYPESEETTINISDYYPDEDNEIVNVRKYTLGVLLPTGTGLDITNRNFLRFTMTTPGGSENNYVFSTTQMAGNSNLQLSKGRISLLDLYLPRHGNNAIIINAEILDWTKAFTDMTVFEENEIN